MFEDYGVDYNGIIWFDCINYFEMMLVMFENLDWVLYFEVEWMIVCDIDFVEFVKEFLVVCNEFEMDENYVFGVFDECVLLMVFLWYNYGKLMIGVCSDIENVFVICL